VPLTKIKEIMMGSIDIRSGGKNPITEVIFSKDEDEIAVLAYRLTRDSDGKPSETVNIHDRRDRVILTSKEHAKNLIAALQYAIDNNWFEYEEIQ
jgi:hypothetical protein